MTKFKKCDYCQLDNKTVKKYKTCWTEFGLGTKKHNTLPGRAAVAYTRVDQFHLCNACLNDLVPEDKHIRNNKIDNDFFEAILRGKLAIPKKMPIPMEGLRKGSTPIRKPEDMEKRSLVVKEWEARKKEEEVLQK